MNDIELCEKCIFYDDFCCRNKYRICINNRDYIDTDIVYKVFTNNNECENKNECKNKNGGANNG